MKKPFNTGLVVGKFAPLHNGHVLLINKARELCDHVVIISYCNPEFEEYPPALRDRWLAACFPDTTRLVVSAECLNRGLAQTDMSLPANTASDDQHRHFVAHLCIRVLERRIDAVFTSESYGAGFARILSERFVEAGLGAAAVTHVDVDPGRTIVPVSGTALRTDPFGNWHHLPQPVAATLVRRVVLLGGESTGKSTLSATLACEFGAVCVAEYGRELWEEKAGALEFADMLHIAREQIRREDDAAGRTRGFLFCDTSPLTTLFYSLDLFGRADPELATAANRRYHYTVLCSPDFPYAQDGTRRNADFTARQQSWYEAELTGRGIRFIRASGSVGERVETIRAVLGS